MRIKLLRIGFTNENLKKIKIFLGALNKEKKSGLTFVFFRKAYIHTKMSPQLATSPEGQPALMDFILQDFKINTCRKKGQ